MKIGKIKSNYKNLFICHRDYFRGLKYRQGGGDYLSKELLNSNFVSLEISHGSFSTSNFFSFVINDFQNNKKKILLRKKINNKFRIVKYIIIIFYFFSITKKKITNMFILFV